MEGPGIMIVVGIVLFVIGMMFRQPKIQPKDFMPTEKELNAQQEKFDKEFAEEKREEISDHNDVLIPLINKKDGSAITFFLNQAIEKEEEGMIANEKHHCNTLFNLFKFFTLKRTPISDQCKSGNFLEDLIMRYSLDHDIAETEIPDEVNDYISNGQMESELNEEHFEILKDEIHRLCVAEEDEYGSLRRYLGFADLESHSYLTYILYSKNNPKMAAIELKVDDSELDILYKEFSQLLSKDELNTLYENAEKYRAEYIEELVEKVNEARKKEELDHGNFSEDLRACLDLASNYALDANIAGRLKGKALLQEILDQKIADDDSQPEEDKQWATSTAKEHLEWF
jgi:hypothetical protein